ncbi:MAG: methionine--tRNA ligase [Candidatus Liptonbacteria bacterium]
MDKIKIEEFLRTELKTAKVVAAEKVPESEKLVRLELEAGDFDEKGESRLRQIVAGIGKAYAPEELLGKTIVIVANLEPRELMGLTSEGMLLAATGTEGVPKILIPEKEVEPGSRVR